MISRRAILISGALLSFAVAGSAQAADAQPFSNEAFTSAQAAGKPILIDISATWCPTCKAQEPIIGTLRKSEKFKDFVMFRVDFDEQKDAVKSFGARSQSTLIVYKGKLEVGRSVGDTNPASIETLLEKAI